MSDGEARLRGNLRLDDSARASPDACAHEEDDAASPRHVQRGDRTLFAANPPAAAPWYADGLRFTCTQCGRCCGGAPGYVWVTPAEVMSIANRLHIPLPDFEKRHVRHVGVRRSLKELRNGDCEFLRRREDGRAYCSIYEDRPRQCRTWPFWEENLASPQAWAETAESCPGMNQGTHHPLPVITAALKPQ